MFKSRNQRTQSIYENIRKSVGATAQLAPPVGEAKLAFESLSDYSAENSSAGMAAQGVGDIYYGYVETDSNIIKYTTEAYGNNLNLVGKANDSMATMGALANIMLTGSENDPRKFLERYASETFTDANLVDYSKESNAHQIGGVGYNSLSNQAVLDLLSKEAFVNNVQPYVDRDINIAYNMLAVVQDPLIDAFFPTVIRTPDKQQFSFRISIDSFFQGYRHPEGNVIANEKLGRRPLMEVVRNPFVLLRDELRLVPAYIEDGANPTKDFFVPKEKVVPTTVVIGDRDVMTNPLKFESGVDYNLLGMSKINGILEGIVDETDGIDPSVKLKNLFIQLKDGNNHVVKYETANVDSSVFVPTLVGNNNEFQLTFKSNDFVITHGIQNTLGAAITDFNDLLGTDESGYHLRCTVEATMKLNLETGTVTVVGGYVRPYKATKWTKDVKGAQTEPEAISLTDATLKGYLTQLKLSIVGFELDAFHNNQNLRAMGTILDSDFYVAFFRMLPKAPIRVQHRITADKDDEFPTVEKLVTATRTRRLADGYRTLEDFEKTLIDMLRNNSRVGDYDYTTNLSGVGARVLKPFYERTTFDPKDQVIYTDTRNFMDNLRMAFVNQLQLTASRMVQDSHWLVASAMLNGGTAKKPKIIIGTSQFLASFLNTTGDLKVLGDYFECEVVTSVLDIMRDRIYMTVVGETDADQDGFGVLNFGHTFVLPDVVVKLSPHAMNGTQRETTVVIPRYQHVPNTNVLARFDVVGLEELVKEAKAFPINVIKEVKMKPVTGSAG